jgi:hypothetical protein
MNIIQPWKIEIGHVNVNGTPWDMTEFATEVFNLNLMTGGQQETQVSLGSGLCPIILEMRDTLITPLVKEFARNQLGYILRDGEFEVETNAKWIPKGEGLYPHQHSSSILSVIVYPQDSKSGLNFFDPRTNAGRGFPREIRDEHFARYAISPKAGDVFIFPSYLQHSVSYVEEDIRLSLLHEYYPHSTR